MDNNYNNEYGSVYVNGEQKDGTNAAALIGFILSFMMALPGLIFSILGLIKAKKLVGYRKGFAIAGLIISGSQVLFYVVLVVVILSTVNSMNLIEDGTYDESKHPVSHAMLCLMADECIDTEDGTYVCKATINEKEYEITCNEKFVSNDGIKIDYYEE